MFILNFIPDSIIIYIVHICLVLGIIGTILDYFIYYVPQILPLRIAIKILSTILLILSIFFEGYHFNESAWQGKISEVEEQLAIAEANSHQVDVVIQEKVVEKIKVVKEQVDGNAKMIKLYKEYIDSECKIPDIAIKLYNSSIIGGNK